MPTTITILHYIFYLTKFLAPCDLQYTMGINREKEFLRYSPDIRRTTEKEKYETHDYLLVHVYSVNNETVSFFGRVIVTCQNDVE